MGSGLNKIRNCILNWNQFINGKTSVDTLDNNIHVHDNFTKIDQKTRKIGQIYIWNPMTTGFIM